VPAAARSRFSRAGREHVRDAQLGPPVGRNIRRDLIVRDCPGGIVESSEKDAGFLARLRPHRFGVSGDVDAADVLALESGYTRTDPRNGGVAECVDQVRGQRTIRILVGARSPCIAASGIPGEEGRA
jgi:hypothetical protein